MRGLFAPAALAAAIASGPAFAVAPAGDPALYWNEVFISAPWNPGQTRPAALLNIAIHDSVNATLGRPNKPYLGYIATGGGDTRAAVAVAARNLLANQYPARTAEFDAALAVQLALVPDGAAKTAGMATGATIAAATLAKRAGDGCCVPTPYTPSGLPGRWAPTPPGYLAPVAPQQATMQSWLGMQNDDFRAVPPPAIDSAEYAASFALSKEIGSATSATRTADQSAAAQFWVPASGPAPWIRAAIDIGGDDDLSSLDYAAKLATLTLGIADATIAVWDTKYEYDYWRPVTAIRNADLDGNAATDKDAGWMPYIITPNHPSYASAHSSIAGAASVILSDWLGDSTGFCLTASGLSRCFDSFSDAADDAMMSRLWGGIHWDFDNSAGMLMGQRVGAYALASDAFDAVPEPAAWAMLIVGFGVVGRAVRRRRAGMSPA